MSYSKNIFIKLMGTLLARLMYYSNNRFFFSRLQRMPQERRV